MYDFELLIKYLEAYKVVVDEFSILLADEWNFDETRFCIGIGHEDWVISIDILRRIYSKCPGNREAFTAIECINGICGDIPPILILTKIQ